MRLNTKRKNKKPAGNLRQGQIISTFGCGAIVDLPGESAIIAGTDYWNFGQDESNFHLNEENLQQYLGVDFFKKPPERFDENGFSTGLGIPAFRFPKWMYCPKCKRLAPETKFIFTGKPKCQNCRVRLVPSRFVVACEKGHLYDFPYQWWVSNGKCKKDKIELFIEMSGEKSTLDSIIITCRYKKCDKEKKCRRSMAGSFGPDSLKGFKCKRVRPWLNDVDNEECEEIPKTMQRGATNLHFSITASALSIPPWSGKLQQALEKNWRNLAPLVDDPDLFITIVKKWELPDKHNCSAEELFQEAKKKKEKQDSNDIKSWQEILEGEYNAFLRGTTDEEGEFKTKKVNIPEFWNDFIGEVTLGMRLREVLALRGFKRINPDYDVDEKFSFNKLGKKFTNWLPAIELKGEGIFIKLNQEKVKEWESRPEVLKHYSKILTTNNGNIKTNSRVSPRYILLHSFAHLFIRELVLQCGYSSAAIKERIYSTFFDEEEKLDMSGVLVYTASNDSEGSLGGIVGEGKKERLAQNLSQLMEKASWCSADPLCIQSAGQGLNALNLGACHSCTLLPETSCEARNCFLDRGAIVGTIDNPSIGFFSELLVNREV